MVVHPSHGDLACEGACSLSSRSTRSARTLTETGDHQLRTGAGETSGAPQFGSTAVGERERIGGDWGAVVRGDKSVTDMDGPA